MTEQPKRTLLTGASSGLGRTLALELALAGHRLVLVARRAVELEETAKLCRNNGALEAHALTGDISDPIQAAKLVQETEKILGGIDILIANAGISRNANAANLTWEHCAPVFNTNVTGTVSMIIAALPGMLARHSGQIIGVSSIAAFRGLPTSAAYCASKAACTAFLESLRPELATQGIAVSVVSPGFIKTPLTMKNKFPMPFLMSPEKAARIIARGIARKNRHIAFPLPMVFAMRLAQVLPARLFDFLMNWKKIEA